MTESLVNISLFELCEIERVEQATIIEIVDYDIVQPIKGDQVLDWVFDASSVRWIKKALRLHQDLEVDWVAVALVIELMQQKESLQRENERYQQQLARFMLNE